MAPEEDGRGGPESSKRDFEGRDLLVGRPEGAERRSLAATGKATPAPLPATSPQPAVHDDARDDAIGEILETVRSLVARLDTLQEAPKPEHESAEALARETAALTQAVRDARGAMAKAEELAAQQDGAAEAAQLLAKGVAALRAQGEALDQRLQATGQQANQTGWQAETVAQGIKEMMPAARSLESSLRIHTENMSRINRDHRRRRWFTGLVIGSASFVFFALGLVLQRETDLVSFGDPRDAWNDHVEEHFTPTLAACTSRARELDAFVRCQMHVGPSRELTVPLYPDVGLTKVPPEEEFNGTTDR